MDVVAQLEVSYIRWMGAPGSDFVGQLVVVAAAAAAAVQIPNVRPEICLSSKLPCTFDPKPSPLSVQQQSCPHVSP